MQGKCLFNVTTMWIIVGQRLCRMQWLCDHYCSGCASSKLLHGHVTVPVDKQMKICQHIYTSSLETICGTEYYDKGSD